MMAVRTRREGGKGYDGMFRGGLRAEVFPAAAAAPMICLSSNEDEREALRAELADAPAHTLVCVTD